jgi:hypothetical protein
MRLEHEVVIGCILLNRQDEGSQLKEQVLCSRETRLGDEAKIKIQDVDQDCSCLRPQAHGMAKRGCALPGNSSLDLERRIHVRKANGLDHGRAAGRQGR